MSMEENESNPESGIPEAASSRGWGWTVLIGIVTVVAFVAPKAAELFKLKKALVDEPAEKERLRQQDLEKAVAKTFEGEPSPRMGKATRALLGLDEGTAHRFYHFPCKAGLHLVLPDGLRDNWRGGSTPDGRPVPGSDYARACEVTGRIGLIAVAQGEALLLVDGPPRSAWGLSPDGRGVDLFLLKKLKNEDWPYRQSLLSRVVKETATDAMTDTGLRWRLPGRGVTLKFAGDTPDKVSTFGEWPIRCEQGTYKILEGHYNHEPSEEVYIYRLLPIDQ